MVGNLDSNIRVRDITEYNEFTQKAIKERERRRNHD